MEAADALGIPVRGTWGVPLIPISESVRMVGELERRGRPIRLIQSYILHDDGGTEPTQLDKWYGDMPLDWGYQHARWWFPLLNQSLWVFIDLYAAGTTRPTR